MAINFELSAFLNPVFIETGSGSGDGVLYAIQAGFAKIYSIELSDMAYAYCCRKFAQEIASGRVTLIHGDSLIELPKLLKTIDQQATFWLDAQGGYPSTVSGKKICPIIEELVAIIDHPVKGHTILIDDRRQLGAKSGWGKHIPEEKLKKMLVGYSFTTLDGFIPNDVLVATYNTVQEEP